ncbi:MAG TPA: carbohydrate kinase family protein, partial [Alphaproteobacteria bacterium]|nr:carbohydrate kinase family protein [Alphaproteobacteria bacterium]
VAVDHIMVFEDRFKNHILADKVHMINVSFFVPSLEKRWGGTGANIAFNLRRLGEDPVLLAAVGSDLGPYASWLDEVGIRRDWLLQLDDTFTSQCFITTDLDNNQLTSFHPGAMERAHEARLEDVDRALSVGIVAPNGKQAMLDYARGLKQRGVPCVLDPGQGLPMFDGEELLQMIDGAAVYVVNDYEWSLTQEKTGLGQEAIAERVGALIVTRGAEGSLLIRGREGLGVVVEEAKSEVPAVPPERVVDPTGCGDAYRSGILYAIHHGQPLETGARIGSLMGSLKVARQGPQSIELGPDEIRGRYEEAFGQGF